MKKLNYVLNNNKGEITIVLILISTIQLISIYVYNFLPDMVWFKFFENTITCFYFGVVTLFPYYLCRKMLIKKIDNGMPFLSSWALGLSVNTLLLVNFLVFGLVDFGVKRLTDVYLSNAEIMAILFGFVFGTILILAFGIGAGWVAQIHVKK